jgi:hypothetical protein
MKCNWALRSREWCARMGRCVWHRDSQPGATTFLGRDGQWKSRFLRAGAFLRLVAAPGRTQAGEGRPDDFQLWGIISESIGGPAAGRKGCVGELQRHHRPAILRVYHHMPSSKKIADRQSRRDAMLVGRASIISTALAPTRWRRRPPVPLRTGSVPLRVVRLTLLTSGTTHRTGTNRNT